MNRLNKKVALISGALGGQGQVAVAKFIEEGAQVVATDLAPSPQGKVASLLESDSEKLAYLGGDLCDSGLLDQLVNTAITKFGRIDVLFSNHGVMVGKPFLDTTSEELDRVLAINLRAPFLLSQLVAKQMVQQGSGGSIVHNSSVGGIVGFPTMAAYGASKAGLAQLARSMATDLAEHGIRVNAICPGVVDTPMPERYVEGLGVDKQSVFQEMEQMHLMKRLGKPEEIVNLALFLASDESSFMTGSVIPIDGGLTAI
ncbi:MAG: SDR family NAD(P)-dependent oxidoreductase [Gammaproteobacteria bacterium]|jgi:NAD(P)-dependent dehydrogenase (short-subunit alcohol dehydrogenase family)